MRIIIVIAVILLIISLYYKKDYYSGLIASSFFLLITPYNLFIRLPGGLPNLTVHRFIIVIMFICWLSNRNIPKRISGIPYIRSLIFVSLTILISAIFSVRFAESIKTLLSFVIEQILFYSLIFLSLKNLDGDQINKVGKKLILTIIVSLTVVSFFGILERWSIFNVMNHLQLPKYGELAVMDYDYHHYSTRIGSTYPHPILLGYALSMVWPLILAMIGFQKSSKSKYILVLSFLIVGSCLYFTESRGPWLGSVLAGVGLFIIASPQLRKKLLFAGFIFVAILFMRPQITTTLENLVKPTTDVSSFKGRSANYRLELWYKALDEIGKSPLRTLIGYGDQSHLYMNLSGYEKKTGKWSFFWSWDNEYACILFERGFLGFIAFLSLYFSIFVKLLGENLSYKGDSSDLMKAIISSIGVFLFMMTNVKSFSPQILFLFWLLVAVSLTLTRDYHPDLMNSS